VQNCNFLSRLSFYEWLFQLRCNNTKIYALTAVQSWLY